MDWSRFEACYFGCHNLRLCSTFGMSDLVSRLIQIRYFDKTLHDEAVKRIRRLTAIENAVKEIDPFLDQLVCYASTPAEFEPNRIIRDLRGALKETDSEQSCGIDDARSGRLRQ